MNPDRIDLTAELHEYIKVAKEDLKVTGEPREKGFARARIALYKATIQAISASSDKHYRELAEMLRKALNYLEEGI